MISFKKGRSVTYAGHVEGTTDRYDIIAIHVQNMKNATEDGFLGGIFGGDEEDDNRPARASAVNWYGARRVPTTRLGYRGGNNARGAPHARV